MPGLWSLFMKLANLLLVIILCEILLSCSSSSKLKEPRIKHAVMQNMHFRRPPHRGSNPNAERGDEDYRSYPEPNSRYDCEPIDVLFNDVDLSALRSCW